MDKQSLRGEIAIKRRALSAAEVATKSRRITERLSELVDWSKVRKVHCYVPFAFSNEVDTRELVRWMQQKGIDVSVPGVIVTQEELEAPYDLIIVPIVAFDSYHQRIGFGGGFYDRLLAAHSDSQKIGVAYGFQKVDKIPAEPHDQPLDAVVTDTVG